MSGGCRFAEMNSWGRFSCRWQTGGIRASRSLGGIGATLARLQVKESWHSPPSSLPSELLSSTSPGWCDATAPWSVVPHANGLAYGMTNRPTANAAISEVPTRPDLVMLNSRRVCVNVRSSQYEDFIRVRRKVVKKSLGWLATPFTAHRLSSRCGSNETGLVR